MGDKPKIVLDDGVVERCRVFGAAVVDGYLSGKKSTKQSTHGVQFDPVAQARARMGECAFALWAGIDIERLDWGRSPDGGSDLVVNGWRVDVKTTASGVLLIWPVGKTESYAEKEFDVLALVRGAGPDFSIEGVISKARFEKTRLVAGVGHRLTKDTRYVHRDNLFGAEILFELTPRGRAT